MEVVRCKFFPAWSNACGKAILPGKTYCEKHKGVKCVSCGQQATHECNETYQLVCGAPLCDNCHDIGNMKHVPKNK